MTACKAGRACLSLSLLALGVGFCGAAAQQPQPSLDNSQTPQAASPAPAASTDQPSMADVLRKLNDMSAQLLEAQHQIEQLQTQVGQLRQQLGAVGENSASVTALKEAVDQIKDDQEMTHTQVATLEQTKVQSYSRYPVTLTGLVLFNSYVVDGSVDNPALPMIALNRGIYYPHHSLGATFNQTQLGVKATGPTIWNARSAAQISADFFADGYHTQGSPQPYGSFHLKTGEVELDWPHTQVTAGLEAPLISPLSPTSFASVAEPSLSWAGNLWTWLPQLTIEQSIEMPRGARMKFGFGALDPEAGDVTSEVAYGIMRQNLQPGYEARTAWEWGEKSHPFELGANGYYTRQLFYGSEKFDFWAGTADWRVPLAKPLELSGEFYRGRGIGDLGGGAFKNIVTGYEPGVDKPLDAGGGWTQLAARLGSISELNAFFGLDSANGSEVRKGTPVVTTSPYLYLVRNQSFGGNFILRPRTYIVLSAEYRALRSWYVSGPVRGAQNVTLSTGYIF